MFEPQTRSKARGGPRRWGAMRIVGVLALAGVVGAVVFALGFLLFLANVPDHEVTLQGKADGFVVLTVGTSRLEDAIELLASGRGQRLLISGVHPTTRLREISQLRPEHQKYFACFVDLDRFALNTVGNAVETKRWVQSRGFKSLIVVTSNYHMPRAMAELAHQLPDTTLIAFPVVAEQSFPHWISGSTLRLLFSEYVKYTVAIVRMRLPVFT